MGALPNNNRKESNDSPDLYVTNHPLAIPGLFSRWRPESGSIILEPCCGLCHISDKLEEFGHVVHSFDMFNWGRGNAREEYDAQSYHYGEYECIITNPPYNRAMPIVENLLEQNLAKGGYMAMLVRLEFQTGKARAAALEQTPLKYILPFAFRIECDKGVVVEELADGSFETELEKSPNSSNYAWFVWEDGYEGYPTTMYIHQDMAEQTLAELTNREV
ncbi:DNA methyltransferase [Vibrio phage SSP002]|uniref:Conjugal transfer protein n=3 Tax=root TaxID=1 RepID=H9EB23_9CAUD|nr:hypothetical protein [Vibrio alginolyticus]YP_009598614.1 DNA methyltransferase [Vibrio phage SSP002]AFE86350.1 hypothetical protein SSP002_023 [Vibrio phage SSP002]